MITVNRMTDYAALVMTHFALQPERSRTALELGGEVPLPSATLRKLLRILTAQGLLVSQRGRHGGFRLARPPSEINLAQVMEAMDGPLTLTACSHHGGSCSFIGLCAPREHWLRIGQGIRTLLESTSLAQLAGTTLEAREILT
ncbi:MAG: Rrf2 family transcriptional regulator [Magnetococcales bacterium]|nr:Rrf2 family transcriptional regulator [Magnetococcales bacterium]